MKLISPNLDFKLKINYSANPPIIEVNPTHSTYLLEVIRIAAGVLIIIPDAILTMIEKVTNANANDH